MVVGSAISILPHILGVFWALTFPMASLITIVTDIGVFVAVLFDGFLLRFRTVEGGSRICVLV